MNKLLLACIAISLVLIGIPSASGQDNGYPACTESEILVLLSTLLDYVPLREPSVDSIEDLAEYAGLHLEQREASFSLLPLCHAAIVTQRQIFALYGDFVGASALDRAGVSGSANPYFARNLANETGIDRAMQDLMAAAGAGDAARRPQPDSFLLAHGK